MKVQQNTLLHATEFHQHPMELKEKPRMMLQ